MSKPKSFFVIGIVNTNQEMSELKYISNVALTGIKAREIYSNSILKRA